jgi:hypothetical protein
VAAPLPARPDPVPAESPRESPLPAPCVVVVRNDDDGKVVRG